MIKKKLIFTYKKIQIYFLRDKKKMVLSFVKDQIGFDHDKKKNKKLFYVTEKIKFVSIFEKDIFFMKRISFTK